MQENRASRVFILSAVLLGVLAMVLAFVYLNQQDAHREGEMTIVVAKHDLASGRPVDPAADFDTIKIPARPAFARFARLGLSEEAEPAMKGQRVNRTILAGMPIMLADFSSAADMVLDPNLVGLSVPVRGANAMSGLLIPGDMVKVLVTRPIVRPLGMSSASQPIGSENNGPQWETKEVVPMPLKVLAVGSRLVRSRQQFSAVDQYNANNETDNQATVTLEVTSDQARTILEQTGAGQLPVTLILCKPAAGASTEPGS